MIITIIIIIIKKMAKNILIFLSNIDYTKKCDEVIEYSTNTNNTINRRMIPDDYIEEIRYLTGSKIKKLLDIQTYPDNWGCHNKEIISFIFKKRYCSISELFSNNSIYISVRIYPSINPPPF
jgi:hypothetical protein